MGFCGLSYFVDVLGVGSLVGGFVVWCWPVWILVFCMVCNLRLLLLGWLVLVLVVFAACLLDVCLWLIVLVFIVS